MLMERPEAGMVDCSGGPCLRCCHRQLDGCLSFILPLLFLLPLPVRDRDKEESECVGTLEWNRPCDHECTELRKGYGPSIKIVYSIQTPP